MIKLVLRIAFIIILSACSVQAYTDSYSQDSLSAVRKRSTPDKDQFLKRNPAVKGVAWTTTNSKIYIYLKNGTHQSYSLKNKDEINAAEKKYGKLPKNDIPISFRGTVTKGPVLQGTGPVYDKLVLSVDPEYIHGMKAFAAYIKRNFNPPVTVSEDIITRTILVRFVVEPDSSLTNIHVVRDPKDGSATEAIRVIREAGKWKPGIKDGKAVRVIEMYPIKVK